MNHKMFNAARALAAIAFISPVALVHAQAAATTPSSTASAGMSSSMSTGQRMRASNMMGSKVLGAADKKVGDIKDLIVDMTTGKVRYALLEFDPGFMKSDMLYAVPVTALGASASGRELTYREVSREQLKRAAVDKKDWTRAVDNKRYVSGLDENYGFKPPAGTARSIRASKVIGRDVDSRSGKDIGDIKDLVIDLPAGQVQYAVFAFDPSWLSGAKLFAFPLTAFKVQGDTDDLMLDVDRGMLASMKSFDADKWGSLNDLNRDAFINPAPSTSASK